MLENIENIAAGYSHFYGERSGNEEGSESQEDKEASEDEYWDFLRKKKNTFKDK